MDESNLLGSLLKVPSSETAPSSSSLLPPQRSFSQPQFQQIFRSLQTSAARMDIDSAAKFIGAGAATVGVAGSGNVFDYLWAIGRGGSPHVLCLRSFDVLIALMIPVFTVCQIVVEVTVM